MNINKFTLACVLFITALLSPLVLAQSIPTIGTVFEGEEAPGGVFIGSYRFEVEESWGVPYNCGNSGLARDSANCVFMHVDGGQISVQYEGMNGGNAEASSFDKISKITWTATTPGWITSAGISPNIALTDTQALLDAYPNAVVTRFPLLNDVANVTDFSQGISIQRIAIIESTNPITFVNLSIFKPSSNPVPAASTGKGGKGGNKGKGGGKGKGKK